LLINKIRKTSWYSPSEAPKAMECIGDPLSSRVVTERILRPMVKLTREKQKERAKEIVRYTDGKERAAS
jgi:hypothetical protein